MPSTVSDFEKRFSSQEMKDQFKWATNLEAEGNEAAYISFINSLIIDERFKELHLKIKDLKPNEEKKNPWQ